MGSATNSVCSWDPVSMGSEDPVFQSSAQLTSSQETPGGASRKRRAPSEHLCEPTGGSSPVNPGLNHNSPTRSVQCCHPSSPSAVVIDHETLNTQFSSQPSSSLPHGLLWITRNVQQHSLTRPSPRYRDEEAPSTVLTAVSRACQVRSPTDTPRHSAPSLDSGSPIRASIRQLYYELNEVEDYFITEEEHVFDEDQHAALRLDVEEMSYEELLALEDWMGNVNTGISSSEIHEFVKQVISSGNQNEEESCTVCLEAYDCGDTLGQLSCGHAYHFSCITKWIRENPSCPICKCSPDRCGGAA